MTFTAPSLLTFAAADVFLAGPVVAVLDESGVFSVILPATDAPGMNPDGWAYLVKENLAGVVGTRTYAMLLPKSIPDVELADIAPADPSAPNFLGIVGPTGPAGPPGATGLAGPAGATGGKFFYGSDVPANTLGADGDLYIRYDTTTIVALTVVASMSVYNKAAGVWALQSGSIRSNLWYVGATFPTGVKAGDFRIDPTTGDVYQKTSLGSSLVANLKGPAGVAGPQGVSAFGTQADYNAMIARIVNVETIVTTLNTYVTDALNRIQSLETRVTALGG
ncbi:hypothetical protein [Kitasatospora indigofera]|uniref:hypothetical protein n=1 Tax=Kitasatospora indigofera TaxID=67307 RepID=UPI0033ADFB20